MKDKKYIEINTMKLITKLYVMDEHDDPEKFA
jgi:hypothetical protein